MKIAVSGSSSSPPGHANDLGILRYCLRHMLLVALSLISCTTQAAPSWAVDYRQSRLAWQFIQEGIPYTGYFDHFSVELAFDPNDLQHSKIRVLIDTGSLNTGVPDRDEILRSHDFFSIRLWPQARFETIEIHPRDATHFWAESWLTIRGIKTKVLFQFELEITQNAGQSVLQGKAELEIDRFQFGMAQGDWQDTELIGPNIKIIATLKALINPQD